MAGQSASATYAFIGTYTRTAPHVQGKAEGIYVYRVDLSTGALTHVHTMPGVVNPSYLTLDPQHRHLYAVSEVDEVDGQVGGAVSAYAIDQETGALTYLNRQSTRGTWPCHLCVDQTDRFVLTANYLSGSVAVLPILAEGQLGPISDFHQHVGSSVNPDRQQGPHAHSINLDRANRHAVVCDLGLDMVLVYRLDHGQSALIPIESAGAVARPGAGPRHLDFHPSGRYAYVINEIGSTMTAYAYDESTGSLHEIHSLSTLPEGFTGTNHTADVHVHPSGRFVYGSNRGHDSIVTFAVDTTTGRLSYVDRQSTQGSTPRNFVVDSSGTFLFAANQNGDTIVTFRIDSQSGKLTPTGHVASVPSPVCVKIATLTP